MKEPRTIAEILEDEGRKVGYLWVTFTDIQDYNIVVAAIMDIIVTEDYRRRGVGTMMLKRIEKMAEDRGATLLRSDTGVENKASQRFHESFGFRVYRLSYEKVLREPS
jgi:GNAT superfamily N-acetyltransferase